MNKKIEELAMESCLHGYMVHLYTVYAPDGYRVPLENRMISVEKFAELIVKECAKIAQGDRGGDEYWRARASARADILKHFGIANLENLGDKIK